MKASVQDFEIPVAADLLDDPTSMSIDEAVDAIFTERGWPLLGGPSGAGWSMWSTAQRCARLFQVTHELGKTNAHREILGGMVPAPLQIGALFHTLQALYYAAALGDQAIVASDRKGLCAPAYRGPGRVKMWPSNPNAADELLLALKTMCGADEAALERQLKASVGQTPMPEAPAARAPSLSVVLEAERLFDAHTRYWGKVEDVTPLAVEWFAGDDRLGYTCRYDMIARVGDKDPIIPPGVYVFEKKTAKWLDEAYLEGWALDGEPLGQLLLWEPSGCKARFGELTGLVMDVVSKGKVPECKRIILPPDIPAARNHGRWINHTKAQIAMWRATNVYPQSFANCHSRYGRCSNWNNCLMATE